MKCRIIFPNVRSFDSLNEFSALIRSLTASSSGDYDANFFLFGEDILGALDKQRFMRSFERFMRGEQEESLLVSHEKVVSFISKLQKIIGPRDFVIFSVYSCFDSFVVNSVYFIAKKQWFFDLKRNLAKGDHLILAGESRDFHRMHARLNAKLPRCARSAGRCIRNLHVLVCADIGLLKKARPADNAIIFVPACGLPEGRVFDAFHGMKAGARVFINDPEKGCAWDVSVSRKQRQKASIIKLGRKKWVSLDFRLGD